MGNDMHGQATQITNRGRGPELAGTRITVYTIMEYDRAGFPRDEIAILLDLSSQQVQSALDYVKEHSAEVNPEYDSIQARIAAGNAPGVERLVRANREKVAAFVEQCRAGRNGAE